MTDSGTGSTQYDRPEHLGDETLTFYQRLKAGWANADAIAFDDGVVTLTYGELDAATGRAASALLAQGLEPGDRICLAMQKSLAQIVVLLGALRAGLVVLPLNPDSPAEVVADQISRTAPVLLIGEREDGWRSRTESGPAAVPRCLDADPARPHDPLHATDHTDPDRFSVDDEAGAIILFTSGSTGRPKAVIHSHGALFANTDALRIIWDIGASDRLLHVLPTTHAHGLIVAPMPILLAGGTVVLRPRFDPGDAVAWLPRVTCFMGVPFYYGQLLQHPQFTAGAARQLRLAICGSAPILPEVREQVEDRLGLPLLERYGMTETLIMTANSPARNRAGSVGLPLPGWSLRIRSLVTHETAPPQEIGDVEARGPLALPSYLDDWAETARKTAPDDFFRTGDVGWVDTDGFLHITGRADDLIIYAGLNIQPSEVEAALVAINGVVDVCVFGVPHPHAGQAVMAAVVSAAGTTLTPAAIRAELIGKLPATKIPKRVYVVSTLPRNTMGKLRRDLLRKAFEHGTL